jgi:hypothetical protein
VANPSASWRLDWVAGWLGGLGIVLAGIVLGRGFLTMHRRHHVPDEPFLASFVHWDATYYRNIAEWGYEYVPGQQSNIYFFPAYALAGSVISRCTGIAAGLALVLWSNILFGASLCLAGLYVDRRFGPAPGQVRRQVLFALTLVPVGFFFRMAYTESMFLFLVVLELYLIEQNASPWAVATVAGVASATRSVGIVLVLPLVWYVLAVRRPQPYFWASVAACVLLSVSGLLAFMVYCYASLGDPIVFARNRNALWAIRPSPPLLEKAWLSATFEPVRAVFDPALPGYADRASDPPEVLFNLYLANPFYVVGALVLIGVGIWKRWLTTPEILAALGLVLLPYFLNGYEELLSGQGRYVSTAFPLYLVAGKLLQPLSVIWKAPLVWMSSVLLAGYSAHFAQWYWLT